jgi:hypothetical protein
MMRDSRLLPTIQEIREAHGSKRAYERFLPLSRYLFRPLGFWVAWGAIRMGLTSEGVSWLSGLVGLAGCAVLVSGAPQMLPVGIGLLVLFNLLDCVDGSIARAMKTQNSYGRFLDSVCGGIIDLAFWGIIGVLAYQHPDLLRWLHPFGYGPLFWLAVGGVVWFLSVWTNYLEFCFDELLRPAWNRVRERDGLPGVASDAGGPVPSSEGLSGTSRPAWGQVVVTNLRVRETQYCFLVAAYLTRTVDVLLAAYAVFFAASTVMLFSVYVRRGRRVKALGAAESFSEIASEHVGMRWGDR